MVFTFKIEFLTKINIFIFIFIKRRYSHNFEVPTLDKRSDALCNLSLRTFNFTIIFHESKKR